MPSDKDIVEYRLDEILVKVTKIEQDLKENYTKRVEFENLRIKAEKTEENISKAVWIVLTLVITAVVYLVIRK